MKKIVSILIAAVFMITATVTALACGHGNASSVRKYSVCTVENCTEALNHLHSGKTYSPHYYDDGHDYHDYCTIEDCDILGYHMHDGVYYFSHVINDGHNYHGYCGITNCTLSGYHEHNGEYCFANTEKNGYNQGCRNRYF